MRFSDLLKKPLPSQVAMESAYNEGEETFAPYGNAIADTQAAPVADEGCNGTACENDDEDDEFDIDNLSDEDLAELDAELTDDDDDDIGDAAVDAEDLNEVELSPEEEKEADDMMSIASTSTLINNEMNAEERAKFLESTVDVQCAVNEGLLMESDIDEIAAELGIVTEGKNYNKKMIIRLDKDAKMKQLYALGINVSAAAHNDPDYRKLKKVLRMRKILKARLEKKYHAEGVKRMKIYYKRLVSSKSGILSALGKKLTGK